MVSSHEGIVDRPSRHSVDYTVEKLKGLPADLVRNISAVEALVDAVTD